MKRTAVVFPGQGSQYVGMGKDFLCKHNEAREIMLLGEKITGLNLLETILNGPIEELTRTLLCQPAVFGINLVCWKVLQKHFNIEPSAFAGHSLGEYSALVSAGAMDVEEGFYLVSERAKIMDNISQDVQGSLLAVVGIDYVKAQELINSFPNVEVANINSSMQVIAGGQKDELVKLQSFLKSKKVKSVFLKVSGPFHTSHMKPAGHKLKEVIAQVNIKDPAVPVYMNFSGSPVTQSEEIRHNMVCQIYSTVKWLDIVKNIFREQETVFIEAGPGNVLKKLITGIVPESVVCSIGDSDSLASTLNYLGAHS